MMRKRSKSHLDAVCNTKNTRYNSYLGDFWLIQYVDTASGVEWRLNANDVEPIPPSLPRVGDHIRMNADSPFSPQSVWLVKVVLWEAKLHWAQIAIEHVGDWSDFNV